MTEENLRRIYIYQMVWPGEFLSETRHKKVI